MHKRATVDFWSTLWSRSIYQPVRVATSSGLLISRPSDRAVTWHLYWKPNNKLFLKQKHPNIVAPTAQINGLMLFFVLIQDNKVNICSLIVLIRLQQQNVDCDSVITLKHVTDRPINRRTACDCDSLMRQCEKSKHSQAGEVVLTPTMNFSST